MKLSKLKPGQHFSFNNHPSVYEVEDTACDTLFFHKPGEKSVKGEVNVVTGEGVFHMSSWLFYHINIDEHGHLTRQEYTEEEKVEKRKRSYGTDVILVKEVGDEE